MTPRDDWEDAIARERADYALVRKLAAILADAARPLWHIGDGYGGGVRRIIEEAFEDAGLPAPPPPPPPRREPIPKAIRTEVFERDAYRCRRCGGWQQLSIDHVIPLSRGGTDAIDNLQTLCLDCNLRKGTRDA